LAGLKEQMKVYQVTPLLARYAIVR